MKKTMLIISGLLALMSLSACGERDQASTTKRGLVDEKAWKGAHNGFVVKEWTPGDKTVWENQIRARNQYQNEYVKTN
ncbi:MAG: hypothetical protein K2P61_03225 [Burkholderiaceae bacterium]|nr:hypothetical protein [Burkholderiaceae bacterium]